MLFGFFLVCSRLLRLRSNGCSDSIGFHYSDTRHSDTKRRPPPLWTRLAYFATNAMRNVEIYCSGKICLQYALCIAWYCVYSPCALSGWCYNNKFAPVSFRFVCVPLLARGGLCHLWACLLTQRECDGTQMRNGKCSIVLVCATCGRFRCWSIYANNDVQNTGWQERFPVHAYVAEMD